MKWDGVTKPTYIDWLIEKNIVFYFKKFRVIRIFNRFMKYIQIKKIII